MQQFQQKHTRTTSQFIGFCLFCISFVNVSADTKLPINAEKIYRDNCAICHGDQGDANTRAQNGLRPPPRNFTTVEAALELSRDRMIHSVTEGRPGTGMMPHKKRLTTAEIEAVVDFIRTRFMRTPTQSEVELATESKGGKSIYEKNCAVCHGDKGNTAVWAKSGLNPPPRDFTTDEARQILNRERMIKSVTHGRPGTGMMPFKSKFSATEIASVVDYVRKNLMRIDAAQAGKTETTAASQSTSSSVNKSTSIAATSVAPTQSSSAPHQGGGPHVGAMPGLPGMSPELPSGHAIDVDMSLPLPNNMVADVKWGREFYMKNCFVCHGIKGQGDGPRASFNIPRPRNFTSVDSRRILNRPRIVTSITKGRVATVMPAWGKVLDNQQIANLAEFVFEAFIQPDKFNALPAAEKTTGKQADVDSKKKAP